MTTFDCKCEKCNNIWEVEKKYEDPAPECPECGSNFTKTILTGFSTPETKDPYDYLEGYRESTSKPIKSFANDKRKGGRG